MKKKIILAVAVMLTLALCTATFVACTPSDVGKYMEELKKSDHGTIESMGMTISYVGKNLHMKMSAAGMEAEYYYIVDGDKKTVYTKLADKWTKSDSAIDLAAMEIYKPSTMLAGLNTKKENYDIKKGVWTDKITKTEFKIEKGSLVVYMGSKEIGKYSTKKPTIELPKEAKELK